MNFKTLKINLTDDEQLRLICVAFGISLELLEDIKNQNDDHETRIVQLVMSEAVARALTSIIEAEEDEEDKQDKDED